MRDVENNSLQGIIDQVVLARPITKFAHRMMNPEDTPRIIKHAVATALNGAPGMIFRPSREQSANSFWKGPVLVDFPIDVLFTPVHEPLISWGSITSPLPYKPGPHEEMIIEAAQLLNSAKRPVIILGSGANSQEVGINMFNAVYHVTNSIPRQHNP